MEIQKWESVLKKEDVEAARLYFNSCRESYFMWRQKMI